MEGIVYVNGEYIPANEASVSVFDHGFLYGDGIFESMVSTGDFIFRLEDHIDRLYRSAAALRLPIPLDKETLADAVRETVRRNDLSHGYIRLLISRGPGYPSLDPRAAPAPSVIILVHSRDIPGGGANDGVRPEVRAIEVILAATRRTPSECLDARIKACNYLNHIMARMEAIEAGVDDAVLLDIEGNVAEATAANLFVVRGSVVSTPPVGNVLEGITRSVVMEVAGELGYRVEERDLTPYDLYTSDEIFLASTFGGITPVGKVTGRVIGDGRPGPITMQVRERVHALRDNQSVPAVAAT
ncbi:MAG TPA: branched-chain-amino-acid transaminase [Chloroflexota bacterium]|nr:branched-chain-amino-acid transaminase [Chloroflexota bacterium]